MDFGELPESYQWQQLQQERSKFNFTRHLTDLNMSQLQH